MTYFLYTSLGILVILSIGAFLWWYRRRRRLQNRRRGHGQDGEKKEFDTITQEGESSQSDTASEPSNILFDLSESDDSKETENPLPLLESPIGEGRELQAPAEILNIPAEDDTETTDLVFKERRRGEEEEKGIPSLAEETISSTTAKKETPGLPEPSKFSLFSFRKRGAEPATEERFTTTLSTKRRGATPRLEEDNHEVPSKKRGAIRWSEEEPFSNITSLDSHRHGTISPPPSQFPEEVASSTTFHARTSKNKTKDEFFLAPPELILAFYVVPQHGGFHGTDILDVLEELGLRYGDMKIFHHYGIGEIKVKKPVFSIANMLEPGTFDVQRISKFVSPGLVLFMRLPGPFGGRIAFELMLNNAQKIAEILEGILEDDKHQPMTPQTINLLRERIANFERRDTPISLRKRFS